MATTFSGYFQWFFRVPAVLFLGVSWRTFVCVCVCVSVCVCVCVEGKGGGVFIKLQATVFSAVSRQCFCVGVFLSISFYLGAVVFRGIFQWLFLTYLSLHLYYYPLLFSLCIHVQGFYNCHIHVHYYSVRFSFP